MPCETGLRHELDELHRDVDDRQQDEASQLSGFAVSLMLPNGAV
jgi:hypothetical protein